ncbi:hypothetical protein NUW54_g2558 [Trametes sanguinea]|uniref:Uncharacterized protein n=1 Tax=Trametes sanguinea TaxID=158606 RepID=A0ACC1Q6D1_9APHY|nr:hypothetical protein NUW54_g2558 [Trametes sanguinea]
MSTYSSSTLQVTDKPIISISPLLSGTSSDMPRDAITLAGLQALRDALPSLDPVLFEANTKLRNVKVLFNNGLHRVDLAKRGFTQTNYSNIFYTVQIVRAADGGSIMPNMLSIYVHKPSAADPTANREAFVKALDSFMATEVTVLSRDVFAT